MAASMIGTTLSATLRACAVAAVDAGTSQRATAVGFGAGVTSVIRVKMRRQRVNAHAPIAAIGAALRSPPPWSVNDVTDAG
ncbi:MAG: hypothetical protein AAF899_01400 [Pseudomonadota bacterium]